MPRLSVGRTLGKDGSMEGTVGRSGMSLECNPLTKQMISLLLDMAAKETFQRDGRSHQLKITEPKARRHTTSDYHKRMVRRNCVSVTKRGW
jgi:hypothetical protein